MRHVLIALAGLLGVITAVLAFLLTTNTGLRWTIDQVVARSGAPIEIEGVEGRLLGPASLSGIEYRQPDTGATVQIQRLDLDWRPSALLSGLLHVTRLDASGVDYRQGAAGEASSKPNGPAGMPAIPLDIRIDRLGVESLAVYTGRGPPTRIKQASLSGAFDGESVLLRELSVESQRYSVAGGRIRLGLGSPWPIEGRLDWSAAPPDMAPFAGSLEVSGGLEGSLSPSIELREPFTARARGALSGLPGALRWTIDARIPETTRLDRINSRWPALALQGAVTAQGDTNSARLQPDVTISFMETNATLTGELEANRDELVVAAARLAKPDGPGSVDFSGRLGLAENLPFELQGAWHSLQGPEYAPWASLSGEFQVSGDSKALTANLSGSVTPPDGSRPSPVELNVAARGLNGAPTVVGDVRLPYFTYGGMTGTGLEAEIDFHMRGEGSSEVRVNAATLSFGARRISGLEARVTGSVAEHDIALAGQFKEGSLAAGAKGAYTDGAWQGTLNRLSLDSELPRLRGRWQLAKPAELAWSTGETRVGELCLANNPARVCAEGALAGADKWSFQSRAEGLPLRWLIVDSDQPVKVEGTLTGRASLADRGEGISGDGQLRIDSAIVSWQGDEPVTTRYEGLQLDAVLNPGSLQVKLDGTMGGDGRIQGELTTGQPLAADGPINGTLSAHLPSLRVIRAAAPQLGLEQGSARIEFTVAGRRAAPTFQGRADIRDAAMEIEALGMRLSDLSLGVRSEGTRRLVLNGQAMAGDGPLEADGFVEWPDAGGWRGEINLHGSEARLVSVPRALIEGSPDLRVRMDDSGGTVEGRIRLTRAELTPDAGRPGVTLSDDIVVIGGDEDEPASTNPMDWHATVTIDLGDNTHFNGYGLTGRLTGALELDAPPHQPTRASGTIGIHDGQYALYGRSFDIERGRVVYTGGTLDNPGIDLQVDRQVGDVKVSLTVSGPLVEPDLSLTSTPAMSETDRMSYLLLGRPASQASGAEASLLLRAAASLVPGGARGVPAYIQSTLGLDTLEVRSDTAENEGASVVLGKYLSPRLYVSYVAGFQTAVDVFRVRYDLARHWLLRAESSMQGSGGDLLFTW